MVAKPKHLLLCILPIVAAMLAVPAAAEDDGVPYWAALRANEVNMRVGPGEDYRINWVYRRPSLPMKVIRLKEGWRLVRDPDGAEGWVMARLLTRKRGAIVTGTGLAEIREAGNPGARLMWRVEPGVVGLLGDCDKGWCRFDASGHVGFIAQDRLWGAGQP